VASDDLLGKANKLFSKLGSGMRKAAKATTGLGLGDLRIELAQGAAVAVAGGELRGTLKLALSEPSEAKRLMVGLRATQKSVSYGKGPSGIRTATANTVELYRFDAEVGGARRYHQDSVAFVLPVPPDALDHGIKHPDGKLGDVARAVSAVAGNATSPVQWQVVAWLDIPWSQNVKASTDIVVKKP
jgi:hypothetical protein